MALFNLGTCTYTTILSLTKRPTNNRRALNEVAMAKVVNLAF